MRRLGQKRGGPAGTIARWLGHGAYSACENLRSIEGQRSVVSRGPGLRGGGVRGATENWQKSLLFLPATAERAAPSISDRVQLRARLARRRRKESDDVSDRGEAVAKGPGQTLRRRGGQQENLRLRHRSERGLDRGPADPAHRRAGRPGGRRPQTPAECRPGRRRHMLRG